MGARNRMRWKTSQNCEDGKSPRACLVVSGCSCSLRHGSSSKKISIVLLRTRLQNGASLYLSTLELAVHDMPMRRPSQRRFLRSRGTFTAVFGDEGPSSRSVVPRALIITPNVLVYLSKLFSIPLRWA
jgi:hypothetical protein